MLLALAPIGAVWAQPSGGPEDTPSNQQQADASAPERANLAGEGGNPNEDQASDATGAAGGAGLAGERPTPPGAEQSAPTDAELQQLLRLERQRLQGGLSSNQQQQYDAMLTRYFSTPPRVSSLTDAQQQRLSELEAMRQAADLSPAEAREFRTLTELRQSAGYQGSLNTDLSERDMLEDRAATGALTAAEQDRLSVLRRQAIERGYDPNRRQSLSGLLPQGQGSLSAQQQQLLQRLSQAQNLTPSQQQQLSTLQERRQYLGDRQLRNEFQSLQQDLSRGGVASRDQILRYYQLQRYQQGALQAPGTHGTRGALQAPGTHPQQPSQGSVPGQHTRPGSPTPRQPAAGAGATGSNQGSVNTGTGGGAGAGASGAGPQ